MEVCVGMVSTDIRTTTTHRHLHHHMLCGFMCVALHLKCQSNPRCNLTVRKSDEHTKTLSWFINTKVYLLLHFLEVIKKRETAYKIWVNHFSKTEWNKISWEREREQTQTLILTFPFSAVVSTCACLLVLSSQLCIWVWDPFFGGHP